MTAHAVTTAAAAAVITIAPDAPVLDVADVGQDVVVVVVDAADAEAVPGVTAMGRATTRLMIKLMRRRTKLQMLLLPQLKTRK